MRDNNKASPPTPPKKKEKAHKDRIASSRIN